MIDVHSHVIPKIDDGAKSLEEAYEMFVQAYDAGFTDIIATPHYIEKYYEVDYIKVNAWVQAINKILQEKNIELNVHPGNEIYITENIISLIKEKKALTLANSKYVLFELPMNNNVKYLNEIIFEIKSFRMIPVIAHPERYSYVQKNPNILINLIEKGALFQANYGSIIGEYGKHAKNTVKELLKANMIHFLGADCHKKNDVYSGMNKIMIELGKIIPHKKIEELTLINPKHILENTEIEVVAPSKIKKGFLHR